MRAMRRKAERRKRGAVAPASVGARQGFTRNPDDEGPWTTATHAWPIVTGLVPVPDVWRATGLGSAGVVRRQPDGLLSFVLCGLELYSNGVKGVFGKADVPEKELKELLEMFHDNAAPLQEGDPDLARDFAWGGRALAEAGDAYTFGEKIEGFFALLPPALGSPKSRIKRLIGPGGLAPEELVRITKENPQPDDMDEEMEVAIFTDATFALTNPAAVIATLHKSGPEFEECDADGSDVAFNWTRKYPRGHWSPFALMGGRQIIGSVAVTKDRLVASAKTLSMTAKLIDTLRWLLGQKALRLQSTRWRTPRELGAEK